MAKKSSKLKLFFKKLVAPIQKVWHKFVTWRKEHFTVKLHKSFRRSYREDSIRPVETPGLLSHAMTTFRIIFKNWKIFLPFILVMVAGYMILVGLMSETYYKEFQTEIEESGTALVSGKLGTFAKSALLLLATATTGGLDAGDDEISIIFLVLLFLIMWLATIYIVRRLLDGQKVRLRDALYNSLGPLLSTLVVFIVIFIQIIPLMLVAITYNAARLTGFLDTPFYALCYFVCAALLVLLSCYLLSSSIIALCAVTAPGLYPLDGLSAASNLIAGRRTRLVIRVLYLGVVMILTFTIVMLPLILLDLVLKNAWSALTSIPFVPFCLLFMTCFSFIYVTVYIYRYYRWLLDYREK